MKSAFTLALAGLLISAPLATSAQPPGAQWNGDVCHQGAPPPKAASTPSSSLLQGHPDAATAVSSAHPIQCLPYPARIQAHADPCQWVSDFYDGAAHEFEVCREKDSVWRPSGRS
jgi:hypothetical protein